MGCIPIFGNATRQVIDLGTVFSEYETAADARIAPGALATKDGQLAAG